MNVYKYRSGSTRDIESLMNNQFFSASLESLNDIQEAKVKINNKKIEIFDLIFKSKAIQLENGFKEILENFINDSKKFGIYSLSKNYDNELLWAYYSNSHQGFCIEYDLESLRKYQLEGEFFCDINYEKEIPVISLEDILKNDVLIKKLLATKSFSWRHEEEVRIITGTIGVFHYFNSAIKSIYFGFKAQENTIKLVMSVLRGRGVKYYKMHSKKDLYKLERIEISDLYACDSIYLNKTNQFIPKLDETTEPYADLILKAITIVEQEPMCAKVIDAYLSSSKGTNENPVFFITYKDKIRNIPAVNYCISKKEIDEILNYKQ